MKRLLVIGVIIGPAIFGQKKEDIIALQRDVASLQEQVRQLQKSQDDKMAALQALIQQAVDASSKLTGSMNALQRDMDTKLNDQSSKTVAPIATLGTKVDQLSYDVGTVATNVADLARRLKDVDTKVADLKSAMSVIQNPVAAPAPAGGVPGQTGTVPQVGAPACPSAETLWQNARLDESSGKLPLAMDEYRQYVKCFKDTENAPAAQYKVGYLYFQNENYDDAIGAFDDALKFPENPRTQDALYYKAVALQKNHQPTEAGKTYKEYISRYPHGDHVAQAHANLRTLGLEPPSRNRKRD
jgi:TolA-binding protein